MNLTNHTSGEGRADCCAEELGKVEQAAEKRKRYSKKIGLGAAEKVGLIQRHSDRGLQQKLVLVKDNWNWIDLGQTKPLNLDLAV